MENLASRKGSRNYYYRESTPQDIRSILIARDGKAPTEVWKSLNTPDLRAAKLKLLHVRADQHAEWVKLRALGATLTVVPSRSDMAAQVFESVYARFIKVHKAKLREQFSKQADIKGELQRRKEALVQSSFLPLESDQLAMSKLAAAICREAGWDIRNDTPEGASLWDELLRLLTQAIQLARAAIVEGLEGRPLQISRDQVMRQLGVDPVKKAETGASIAELFELYVLAVGKHGRKSADTLNTERKVIAQFAGFVGADRAVSSITKPEVREFRNCLAQVPLKWTSRNDLKGLPLREAAAVWSATEGSVRSDKTIVRELSGLSSFYSWLVREGYAEENPTRDLAPKVDRKVGKYPVYSIEKLRAIFSSALFIGCSTLRGKEHVFGQHRVNDWRFWLPLCALYSGARLGELAQLECRDVRQEDGIWIFDFNKGNEEDESLKKLKNMPSARLVPIHSLLVEIGLLSYVQRAQSKGSERVFPEIRRCARGMLSTEPSKFWQRYLKQLKLKEKGLSMHSFRHTFIEECRRKGCTDALTGSIVGHAKQSMTAHYGTSTEGNLEQRQAAIESISYGLLHEAANV